MALDGIASVLAGPAKSFGRTVFVRFGIIRSLAGDPCFVISATVFVPTSGKKNTSNGSWEI
jgi:hypothetical protein